MSLHKKLNTYTKLSGRQRTKAIKWLARQNEELLLVAFEKQKAKYFKLSKIEEENKSILYLAAYYLAVEELYNTLLQKKRKNKVLNLHEVDDATNLQVKQFKQHHKSEKYEKLLNLKGKIIKLIEEENLSYRAVSEFLKTYHRLEVSHSYIATFYNNIQGTHT